MAAAGSHLTFDAETPSAARGGGPRPRCARGEWNLETTSNSGSSFQEFTPATPAYAAYGRRAIGPSAFSSPPRPLRWLFSRGLGLLRASCSVTLDTSTGVDHDEPLLMPITLDDLRRYAVARSLFTPTTLRRALDRLGFVQADPIRAPARAQDLTLRHRVTDYRAGDLERRYATLGVQEDVFVNYGLRDRAVQALMHPRASASGLVTGPQAERRRRCWSSCARAAWCTRARWTRHFAHGTVTNYWGGSSSATTHLLEDMHYSGCCVWCGATAASGSTPCTSTRAARRGAPTGRRRLTRSSTWPCASTRRCRARACRSSSAGCATPCRNGGAS